MSRTYPFDNWSSIFMIDTISEFGLGGSYPGNGFAVAPLYVYDNDKNTSIASTRQQKTDGFNHVFTSDQVIESSFVSNKTAEITSQFPLYLTENQNGRRANFDERKLRELFSDIEQPDDKSQRVYPEDVIDYIYATLHSPSYRKKYKEFLKADFPKVPRPTSWNSFWELVNLGRELRELHLMRSRDLSKLITGYPEPGSDVVEKVSAEFPITAGEVGNEDSKRQLGRVYINDKQYFRNVPKIAWEFYIGGYQPAQKWLKDRKGRKLSDEDIEHYQKIIKVLAETDRIMIQIDKTDRG